MGLFELLACPICKVHVERYDDQLKCRQCGRSFPIVNGIPVMFPDMSVPNIVHDHELNIINSYNPWVHRVILQSLLDNQIVLEVGSGNMNLNDPNIIRMDVTLTPYVDVVADAHHLPFLPESFDFIFSLAVFEHLRNPFQAAKSIYEALKDGGYIYHECNFVFAYHGYPHHYFNATLQGMEQVFSDFTVLRKGVAPYQMPSFAVEMVLGTYLQYSHVKEYQHGRKIAGILQQVLDQNMRQYDIYFQEQEALKVAAGTYYSGMKQKTPESSLIPDVILDIWKEDKECQRRFPNIIDLTTVENILIWARNEGVQRYPQLESYLSGVKPFNKKENDVPLDRNWIRSLPLIEPLYGTIGFDSHLTMDEQSKAISDDDQINYGGARKDSLNSKGPSMVQKGLDALKTGGLRRFLGKGLVLLGSKLLGYR